MSTDPRAFSTILSDIAQNLQDMVRAELRLAKAEIGEEVAHAKTAGIQIGAGSCCAVFATLFLLLSAFFALSTVVPNWLASLLVAAPLAVVAAVLGYLGRERLRNIQPLAEHTMENIKENVQWVIQRTK
jgi:hypothetical protein